MGRLFNDISNYIPFGKSVIQRRMSYKVGFFMRIVGGLIQVLIMYYLWVAIFNSSSSSIINGFNSSLESWNHNVFKRVYSTFSSFNLIS